MKSVNSSSFSLRKLLIRFLTLTIVILFIPLIAMQFTNEVNWDIADFVVMALLIISLGMIYIFALRRYPKIPILLAIPCLIMFFYFWIELAVGIFFGGNN